MNIDRLNNIAVEAVGMELIHNLSDLALFPDFAGHLVVQSPDNAGNTGDLLDIVQGDLIVALAIPTETHLHRHSKFLHY